MTIYAKVIADSENESGVRLSTLELSYPRFIHGELLTHRVFSRNAMSSRAIPVSKMIEQVRRDPVIPIHWGANQPGMQADKEVENVIGAEQQWRWAAQAAATYAESMSALGLHKQIVNRILEPFQWMRTILTGTEFDNFFELRIHPDAEPHIHKLAVEMKSAMDASTPIRRLSVMKHHSSWHLPYVSSFERLSYGVLTLCKTSAARCARVSYLTHDGATPSLDADLALYDRLAGGVPMHASPLEHQAFSGRSTDHSGNLTGWVQFRQIIAEGAKDAVRE